MIIADVLTIAFRLINLGVLIALLVYLFKKYALGTITQRMIEKKAYVRGLQEQYRSLLYQQEQIMNIRKEEELFCQRLQQQVVAWKHVVEKEQKARMEEKEERRRMLQERAHYKEEYIALFYLKKYVIPRAVEQAKQQLQQHFADKQAGKQYVHRIITRMH